jgi:hypothetical protein
MTCFAVAQIKPHTSIFYTELSSQLGLCSLILLDAKMQSNDFPPVGPDGSTNTTVQIARFEFLQYTGHWHFVGCNVGYCVGIMT